MAFHEFSGVFVSVLDACFKCFICVQTYVANVLSEYFKSRSGFAHVAMSSVAGGQRPRHGFGSYLVRHASPSPLLSLPSFPFPLSRLSVGVGVGVIEGAAFDVGCDVEHVVVGCDAEPGGVGCNAGAGAGASSGRVLRPDVRALALPFLLC